MAFKTTCPKCGKDGHLYVAAGKFHAVGMPLEKDGFSFTEAQNVDTEDERVDCYACHMVFPLSDVMED